MNSMSKIRTVRHGERRLPLVDLKSYSLPLQSGDAFLGDLASGSRFREVLRDERHRIRCSDAPPFGHDRTHEIDGDDLDAALLERATTPEGRVIDQAIQTFSQHLADVLRTFLATPEWAGTERIVCGGGLVEGRVGAEIVDRTGRLLRDAGERADLARLHHAPDEAGMIGWAHADGSGLLELADGFVAVDIGGTNVRWATVRRNGPLVSGREPEVVHHDKWGHAADEADQDELLDRIADGIVEMIGNAERDGLSLSPMVGISCPGAMRPDGRFSDGCQNLPGEWCNETFALPAEIESRLERRGHPNQLVALHNDAVIQALSETPWMQDVERWAAVTMGTGLGNCSFENRRRAS